MKFPPFLAALAAFSPFAASAAPSGQPLGNLGPTGLEIAIQPDRTIRILGVQPGSPAAGKFEKGQVITRINDTPLPADTWDQRVRLADCITTAEAGDGSLRFERAGAPPVELRIPVLGAFSDTWPRDCAKTDRIVAANAAYLRSLAADDGLKKLTDHNLHNALAILALLSTGTDEDLAVVRRIYQERMKSFDRPDTGPHSWHNGYQGIAACEYFLRTGDRSVMPLINAICESARKFQVNGGWTHWATGVNPQYVGGGLLNAAGTNLLTTLLLARQCGARVDEDTLHQALRLFYRFAGHGANPYGDHRPEDGYASNNGKTEQLAAAMQAAAMAENGQAYAMARDKCALGTLHNYRAMLAGHTGPIGLIWYGTAAAYLIDLQPELYRNRMDETRWFFELSRRHDGAFGMSGGARYDDLLYGRATVLGLTAPRRTLQITGAPRSPHAADFELPRLPWGREADLAFLALEADPGHQPSGLPPHLALAAIEKAGPQALAGFARHPEAVYRQTTADAIRSGGHFELIETLLASDSPFARHTACLALNNYQPWSVSRGRGWLSAKSIPKENFTRPMFDALIAMVRDPDEALWLVDQSMIALALAPTGWTMEQLDALLPWFDHDDWWLHESAATALSPALLDPRGLDAVLPKLTAAIARSSHTKGRGFVEWMLTRTAKEVPQAMSGRIADALREIYVLTPSQPERPEGEMDLIGISSHHLAGTLRWALSVDPGLAPRLARLSVGRMDDMRERELNDQTDLLIDAAGKLGETDRREVGHILVSHYRPAIVARNREVLDPAFKGKPAARATPLDKLLDIDSLAGGEGGWKLLGNDDQSRQQWFRTTFEPADRPADSEMNRYRPITLPSKLEGWHSPGYDPAARGWERVTAAIGARAPLGYRAPADWDRKAVKDAGEVVLIRKTLDLDPSDYALLRLVTFTRQGYRIYLNGQPVAENKGRSKTWQPRRDYLDDRARALLKPGRNVLAATSFLQYFRGKEGNLEVYLEGLEEFPALD